MFNENHVMANMPKLTTFTHEDIQNFVIPQVSQYLYKHYKGPEEVMENQLFCDEQPPTSLEGQIQNNSQTSDYKMGEFPNSQSHVHNNGEHFYSQNSNYDGPIRKASDFGIHNNAIMVSESNSFQNTPMKGKFSTFGMVTQPKVNAHNLISPYKPLKSESVDIHYSFLDKND